jgi:proteasome lid subunit RPN8/RPN11
LPNETGSLLLGWWEQDVINVHSACEVRDPTATTHSWEREEQRATVALRRALATDEHPWMGYVGDWHTHPAECGPSSQDRRSIASASRQYAMPLVLLVWRVDGLIEAVIAHRGQLRAAQIDTRSSEEMIEC